jgi:hypothetical protein
MTGMRIPGKIPDHKRKKCARWLDGNIQDVRMRALAREYCWAPIVLYTGSGVSTGPREPVKGVRYGLPTWFSLLKQVSGEPDSTGWPDDPWLAADRAVKLCGGREKFKERLKGLICSGHHYRGYGQLNGKLLANAPTLRAVAAFCGQINGQIINPDIEKPRLVHFRSAANPRIHAVLTANYDCFLESAGSNLYRNSPLRPVTALGSVAGSASRIPVFHIHGYVPHPFYQDESREQTINELIITRSDYEKHWRPDDVFGTTMGPQIHYFRYFTVLFVGFSFVDEYVCRLLRHIYDDYLSHAGRTHYALLEEERVRERGESFFLERGVTPIVYQNHDEIPSILGQLYQAGLATDQIVAGETCPTQVSLPEMLVKKHKLTKNSYHYSTGNLWKIMLACRNESVNASLVREFRAVGNELPRGSGN